jgi:predicted adenine nucleotide alpha hydrolase (AANH) superfamily ATPase
MKKVLLHTCCAPCLSGASKAFAEDDLDVTGYFYNPNIHPQGELDRRIEALRIYSDAKKFNAVIVDSYDVELFKRDVVDRPGERCVNCYRLRLKAAADYAGRNGFDCFSTTLLISPYQKHDLIKAAGAEASKRYGIEFYYRDLRPYYQESIRISKGMGLYRQRYCGCYLSKEIKNEQVSVASV